MELAANESLAAPKAPAAPADCIFIEPPFTPIRFAMVTIFGTVVSLQSMVENAFFFYLFATRSFCQPTFLAKI
jgi:hypothetical protein